MRAYTWSHVATGFSTIFIELTKEMLQVGASCQTTTGQSTLIKTLVRENK